MKELVIVHEREQVDEVCQYLKNFADAQVVALDYWAEQDLINRGVSVYPLTKYRRNWEDFNGRIVATENIARGWYQLPETNFFQHKGLSLGQMNEAILSHYFQEVHAYMHTIESILTKHKDIEGLVVPHSTKGVGPLAGPFAQFQATTVVRVGEFLAKQHHITYKSIGQEPLTRVTLFPQQGVIKGLFFSFYNFCIAIITPQRRVRIYVSDHWRNIRSVITQMHDVELVFADKKEIRNISFRDLYRYRVRFMHPLGVLNREIRAIARARQEEFSKEWERAQSAVSALPDFMYRGVNWWPLVEPVFDFIVGIYAERVIADIESTAQILQREHISRVLVRASISGQHHLFIMSELPHHLGIPSIEIQHGIGVGILDPHSAFGHMHADYVTVYGPLVKEAFVRTGYAPERIQPVGSPRFDCYLDERDALTSEVREKKLIELGFDPHRPVVFVVVQEQNSGLVLGPSGFSSYELCAFIESIRGIQKTIPEIQFILKFRSAAQLELYKDFITQALPHTSFTLQCGDPFPLVLLSDFVYSCFSTLASECIMARKPVLLFPLKAGDTYFYNAHKGGIVPVPLVTEETGLPVQEVIDVTQKLINDTEFYTSMVVKGEKYLSSNFTFTGDAAKRTADFIEGATVPKDRRL